MIELPRTPKSKRPVIRIAGVGRSGCIVLEALMDGHVDGARFVAMNTDASLLAASGAREKVQLGTRGTGAGGDPDEGYTAAEESAQIVRESMEGVDLLILCTGLGGGTGSGATPTIANIAHECGATVVAVVTLPFSFEGKRRRQQAEAALEELSRQARMVLCFENDRMSDLAGEDASAHHAFSAADGVLCDAIRAIVGMVNGSGLLHAGLDELSNALSRADSRCLFGHGSSDSGDRAVEAVEMALQSPLMDCGQMLAEARDIVVHVAAGPGLTLAELGAVMEQVQRHINDHARMHLGVSADDRFGDRLEVTIISATGSDPVEPAQKPVRRTPVASVVATPAPQRDAVPAPSLFGAIGADDDDDVHSGGKKAKVEQMQFEPVSRGRFEKSEPTIVDGQDLDIPTFLRKGFRLK